LAILVAAQGEMINNIESNIHSAKEYVFKAEKDLVKSKENLASARKVNLKKILNAIKTNLEKMLYSDNCNCNYNRYCCSYFRNNFRQSLVLKRNFSILFLGYQIILY